MRNAKETAVNFVNQFRLSIITPMMADTITDCIESLILQEREACASIADDERKGKMMGGTINACKAIAARIRETA